MNYRHHFHAGNFADVMKHALLVRLVRAFQQKPRGFLYLDTHAGRGAYDLTAEATGETLARTPEWPDGIGRLCQRTDLPADVADYFELVRQFDQSRGNLAREVRFYPGSPRLVAMLARPDDRLALYEKHPAEVSLLRAEIGEPKRRSRPRRGSSAGPAMMAQDTDGYVAIRALLPPPERRALVLIDPPYEAQDEFAQVSAGLADGLRRFATGVFALWYPLTERARVQEFFTEIVALRPPPTLAAELGIAGDDSPRKVKGCGLLIVNPPWKFDAAATGILDYLAPVLAQEPGASGRVTWIVPET